MSTVTTDLQSAVDEFNKKMLAWTSEHGCVATFQWSYVNGKKLMEVTTIDKIIYRKEAPEASNLKALMDKHQP